jgi:hypothetical protein
MPRPMKIVAGERQPGRQVSPIREQNVALGGVAPSAGYTGDPPPGIVIRGILGCIPEQEVCGEVESDIRVSRPSRR